MVWSDPEIIALSKQFVPVAEEVQLLYPEDQWSMQRVKDTPGHQLFRRFGEQVPKQDWNHPGTKQGIYMMGPQGEYLGAKFAGSGDPRDIARRMRAALATWKGVADQKGYAGLAIPAGPPVVPPEVAGKPMVLRVALRDLPRGPGDRSGARREDLPPSDMWMDFIKWAWNENWIAFDQPSAWVPKGREPEPVPLFRRLAMETLVDNVRGQAPGWRPEFVREATLTMRRVGVLDGIWTIEYRGSARLDSGGASYAPRLFGTAEWDPKAGRFRRFDLLAIGPRAGKAVFNQRENDPGPAPMGVAFQLVP